MSNYNKGFLTGAIVAMILKYGIRIALMAGYGYVFNQLGLYANDLIMKIVTTLTAAGLANFTVREVVEGYFVDPYDDTGKIMKVIGK